MEKKYLSRLIEIEYVQYQKRYKQEYFLEDLIKQVEEEIGSYGYSFVKLNDEIDLYKEDLTLNSLDEDKEFFLKFKKLITMRDSHKKNEWDNLYINTEDGEHNYTLGCCPYNLRKMGKVRDGKSGTIIDFILNVWAEDSIKVEKITFKRK